MKLVYARWHDLPDLPFRLLAYMALVSMDEDAKPSYWGGWEALALAIGRLVPPQSDDPATVKVRRAALKAVSTALKVLGEKKAISVKVAAAPGRNATYELNLTTRTIHPEREPSHDIDRSNGSRSADTTVHAEPTNGSRSPSPTVHAQRAPEEYEEQVRTQPKDQSADLRTAVTVTRDPASQQTPIDFDEKKTEPRLAPVRPLRRGLGFCIPCYADGKTVVADDPESGDACSFHLRQEAS